MKANWKKILTNKYLLATAGFVALLFFSDKNNVLDQYKLYKQYNKVRSEHTYYEKQIEQARKESNELFTNDNNLERFAREKYLMKRDDEDVYVIVKMQGKEKQPDPVDTSAAAQQ